MNWPDTGEFLSRDNILFSDLLFESLPIGLLVVDDKGTIIVFNPQLQKLSGLNRNDVINKPYKILFPSQTNPANNKLQLTLLTGIKYENLQPESILPIKPIEHIYVTTQPIRDNNDTIIGAMALFIKATRLKALEQAIIQAEKLAILGQLAASAFHEVKNQLTVAGGFLQLLSKKFPDLQYINIINESFQHTSNIVNDFLQLAKPGYAQRKTCSITELINHIVTLIQGEATKYKLEIEKVIPQDLPRLIIDEEQIKQVLINIIKNGLEAMPNGGKLIINASVYQEQNSLNIDIIDSGTGMNEETKKSLFKPFYTTKESGTGLGMFISQQIISNHGGQIHINSQHAHGTTVTIQLPLPG